MNLEIFRPENLIFPVVVECFGGKPEEACVARKGPLANAG